MKIERERTFLYILAVWTFNASWDGLEPYNFLIPSRLIALQYALFIHDLKGFVLRELTCYKMHEALSMIWTSFIEYITNDMLHMLSG